MAYIDVPPEIAAIIEDVVAEYTSAASKFAMFNSGHEGYAVILEEVHELWDEVRLKTGTRDGADREATQVAAMAVRFMHDVTRIGAAPGAPVRTRHGT